MKIYGVIDRIEDGKIVVINIVDRKGSIYLPVEIFDFKIYEGLWLNIEILPDEEKTKQAKLRIQELQEKLLKRSKKK
ncbi:MAG: DUF3006 domain-containing protein [Endomicrobia bacterium]|nr:DUF3006 domain-containing protein [Endomicrobiia bacterium]MCX7940955.1 DUF3006 domain-containing protein [Endomicrobiia bacterium]MDW8055644.1 DUF3006 family protein [Elusimicrobiota bacterium]